MTSDTINNGWIAVGFSPTEKMVGIYCRIVRGYINVCQGYSAPGSGIFRLDFGTVLSECYLLFFIVQNIEIGLF
jgi:hypothetical protein